MCFGQLDPYRSPQRHRSISDIIRRRSSNQVDVRRFFLDRIDLSGVERVLDLGCGFGFMVEELAPRLSPQARIEGIDACADNRSAYLKHLERWGGSGSFHAEEIGSSLDRPPESYDLILASYVLYFFPQVIPDLPRLLRPGGQLLALTHSEGSFAGLLKAIGQSEDSRLSRLLRRFSAENGHRKLEDYFDQIQRIDYHNVLSFYVEHQGELLSYLDFKLPLIVGEQADEKAKQLKAGAIDSLARYGRLTVEKDDAAFICGRKE